MVARSKSPVGTWFIMSFPIIYRVEKPSQISGYSEFAGPSSVELPSFCSNISTMSKRFFYVLKWGYLQIIYSNRIFHYKPSIMMGYSHLWKPPQTFPRLFPSQTAAFGAPYMLRMANRFPKCILNLCTWLGINAPW